VRGVLASIVGILVEASPRLVDRVERGTASMLAAWLLLMLSGFLGHDISMVLTQSTFTPPWYGYFFLGGAYALSRTRQYLFGALLATVMFPVVAFAHILSSASSSPASTLGFLIIGPFFAGAFLGLRGAFSLAILDVLGILALHAFDLRSGTGEAFELGGPLAANAIGGAVAVLCSAHHQWAEQQRRTILREREEQLRHAQKMEAVGRMAGGIAHDFNNVLTVIAGGVELLRRREDRKELRMIEAAAESAMKVTRQLLLLSRQGVLEDRVADLNSILQGSGQMLSHIIGEGIEVVMDLSDELWSVRADEGRMQQVLLNLATNARDAMPQGGVFRVVTENVSSPAREVARMPPGDYAMVSVSDSGVGMAPEVRERIFEPFFTTKAMGQGTGLGLAIVFGIVSRSGGYVQVDSAPGHGTTFRLYFPRVNEPVESGIQRRQSSGTAVTGTETILVVEDDEAVRDLSVCALREAGYQVIEASSGAVAITRFEKHKDTIDLVLTDVVMPGWSGPELVTRLKARKATLPVLFMSGYAPDTVEAVEAIPAEDLLRKPFKPTELLVRIRAKLDESALAVGGSGADAPPRNGISRGPLPPSHASRT
jgi:signal transduction histidine kinase/CheY-like chemotaxis protein